VTNTASNVFVAGSGTVYVGPLGTTLPTTLNAAPDAAFKDIGYLGPDGVTESQPADSTDVVAWQNGDVCRTKRTKHALTYSFTALEVKNDDAQDFFYGDHPLTATPLEITGDDPDHHALVIDVLDGTSKRRYCIPDGQITEQGDVVFSSQDSASYPVTVTCYPDASSNKAYVYEGTAA
jgi:hypothetical protein